MEGQAKALFACGFLQGQCKVEIGSCGGEYRMSGKGVGGRDGSVAKSIYCSHRGAEFESQLPETPES